MEVNESPVFLRLDPQRDAAQKDLPVYLYESGERSCRLVPPALVDVLYCWSWRVAGARRCAQGRVGMRTGMSSEAQPRP
jgi:hypothetical protein